MQQLGQLHLRAPHQQSPQTIPSDDRSFGDGIILAFGNRNSDRRPYRECTIHAPYTHRTRTVHAPYVNDPITLFLLNLQLEIIKNQVRTIYLHNVTGAGYVLICLAIRPQQTMLEVLHHWESPCHREERPFRSRPCPSIPCHCPDCSLSPTCYYCRPANRTTPTGTVRFQTKTKSRTDQSGGVSWTCPCFTGPAVSVVSHPGIQCGAGLLSSHAARRKFIWAEANQTIQTRL